MAGIAAPWMHARNVAARMLFHADVQIRRWNVLTCNTQQILNGVTCVRSLSQSLTREVMSISTRKKARMLLRYSGGSYFADVGN